MEFLPKLLARQFRWFANVSLLMMFFIMMAAVVVLPVLALYLLRINGYLVIVLLSLYVVCLVGVLAAKYYYKDDLLIGGTHIRAGKKHISFLLVVYCFLFFDLLFLVLPIIYKH